MNILKAEFNEWINKSGALRANEETILEWLERAYDAGYMKRCEVGTSHLSSDAANSVASRHDLTFCPTITSKGPCPHGVALNSNVACANCEMGG